jgi:hypothetical protein
MTIQTSGFVKLAAIVLFAGSALMQGAEQGSFHLPFQARWGETVLEPGDYTVKWPAPTIGDWPVRVTAAAGKTVYELPLYGELMPYSDSNKLILTNVNGEYVVTKLSLGAAGKAYGFPKPKSTRKLTSASGDKLALDIR